MKDMKDKFVLNFRQLASKDQREQASGATPSTTTRIRPKRQTYLHDHRARDSLAEYLDNLEE